MSTVTTRVHRQSPLAGVEGAIAREAFEALSHCRRTKPRISLRVADAEVERTLELPAGTLAPILEVLEQAAAGHSVTVLPVDAELSTAQAAELLNVSEPYVLKLLDAGALPHCKVGKQRKVRTEELAAYKKVSAKHREALLDELVAEAQRLELGYSKP